MVFAFIALEYFGEMPAVEKQVQGELSPYISNKIFICVDGLEDGLFKGRVYHEQLKKEAGFSELGGMLVLVDSMMDEFQFPEASTSTRYFGQKKRKSEGGEVLVEKPVIPDGEEGRETAENGSKATFMVRVQYRQNSTWQGSVKWLENNEEMKFRSALELIKMMDQAMSAEKNRDMD